MLNKSYKIVLMVALCLGMFLGGTQSAEAKAKKSYKKKVGVYTRIKRKIKRTCKRIAKKTRRAVVRTYCGVQNKVMDAGVRAKSRITGKRPKNVWVKGHYKKGNKHHTKGHWRYNRKKPSKKSSAGAYNTGQSASEPVMTGSDPLPPIDPVLPSFSKSKKTSKRKSPAKKR